jgi:hypothetical protein
MLGGMAKRRYSDEERAAELATGAGGEDGHQKRRLRRPASPIWHAMARGPI